MVFAKALKQAAEKGENIDIPIPAQNDEDDWQPTKPEQVVPMMIKLFHETQFKTTPAIGGSPHLPVSLSPHPPINPNYGYLTGHEINHRWQATRIWRLPASMGWLLETYSASGVPN